MPGEYADKSNIIAFALCCAVLFAALNLMAKPISYLFAANDNKCINVFRSIAFLAVIIICFYVAANTFNSYIDFVSERMLPYSYKSLIALIFLLSLVFLSLCEKSVVLKFSLVTFLLSLVVIVVLFILSAKDFKLENISLFGFPKIENTLKQAFSYFKGMFLLVLVLPVAQNLFFKKTNKSVLNLGLLFGVVALLLVILNSLLIFGPDAASKMDYPYCDAVSTVTLSRLFTRMDGFSYFLYFAASLIRSSLCVIIIKKLLEKMGLEYIKTATVMVCSSLYLICIF